jgi:hypothetical protein
MVKFNYIASFHNKEQSWKKFKIALFKLFINKKSQYECAKTMWEIGQEKMHLNILLFIKFLSGR